MQGEELGQELMSRHRQKCDEEGNRHHEEGWDYEEGGELDEEDMMMDDIQEGEQDSDEEEQEDDYEPVENERLLLHSSAATGREHIGNESFDGPEDNESEATAEELDQHKIEVSSAFQSYTSN
jgi:hypothetical protein